MPIPLVINMHRSTVLGIRAGEAIQIGVLAKNNLAVPNLNHALPVSTARAFCRHLSTPHNLRR